MDALIASLPLIFLVVTMGHPRGLSGAVALPLAALMSALLTVGFLEVSVSLALASSITGLLSAFTPLSIVFGAMLMFAVMRTTGALQTVVAWVQAQSKHPIAALMLIGWAFPFLLEGISGFGTPAALAAPLLVGLGFAPLKACFVTLVANSVPVTFGAIGTPIWFGFSEVQLSELERADLSASLGMIQMICSAVVPFLALTSVVSVKEILANWKFILFSGLACGVPFWLVSLVSFEFPSVVGGVMGFVLTLIAAKRGFGLSSSSLAPDASLKVQSQFSNSQALSSPKPSDVIWASFPIWASILILLFTRLPGLGLGAFLSQASPGLVVKIPFLGTLGISPSLVLGLEVTLWKEEVFTRWSHAVLYVPSIVPFILVSALFVMLQSKRGVFMRCASETLMSLKKPCLALFGATVLVKLLVAQGKDSLSSIAQMGLGLSALFGEMWPWFAVSLGALGSFFAGSATISNLTFGPLQQSLGEALNAKIALLTLQAVGAALGNMICLHNIIAVTTILKMSDQDGVILRRNFVLALVLMVLSTVLTFFIVGF